MSVLSSDQAARPQIMSVHTFALVDDVQKTREHWIELLESFNDFKCVAACPSGEEALRVIPAAKPAVILMDIFMPGMSGITCTAQLKVALPQTQILIFTASDDPEMVFPALQAGADGYLIKKAQPAEVHRALLGVLKGELPMTSGIARRVARYFQQKSNVPHQTTQLSNREREILLMLSRGYSNKEIATKLELKPETIHSYLKNVYEKLHVHSRAQAVAKYLSIQSS
jgi:DNA-binding NarL/FixJ family response regulator